ncbi:hypothetical protein BOTBODRAFT_177918 [Botryobasidium botryosum FD-172 SS1]|uniref:Uncharacterized protein n=1 Tax=Botryobasidium botryosum (strain FD-172 SS1) TaxID=930990 RepID=A0A067MFH8_BOTB1|nr:hypothetical protein BOTBODRAFT_177918 [Botryobasidium botryosum FD-172 SS1]
MESLAYTLLMLRDDLPWSSTEADIAKVYYNWKLEQRLKWTPAELFKGLPKEFADFLQYARDMEPDAEPDYDHWRDVFITLGKTGDGLSLAEEFDLHSELLMERFPYLRLPPESLAEWCIAADV